jgi:hypothetical protein
MMTPPIGMIHQLRNCRQASPAVVSRVPGYCVSSWTSTPFSPACMLLTEPGVVPELRTPRQNGALLPGWVLARAALVSFGCGSARAGALAPGAAAGGTRSSCFTSPWAAATPPRPIRASASATLRKMLRMPSLLAYFVAGVA